MRKLIVNTGTLYAGGAERVLSVLSKSFADTFDEVQFIMWLDAKYPEIYYQIDKRVKIVRISKESGTTNILRNMLWFRHYVKKEKPDLVLSLMVMICFAVTVSLLFTGYRQVVAERNDPRFFKRKWLRKIINFVYMTPDVKGIIMQTEWNKAYFSNKKLFGKTSVIYNPIDLDKKKVGISVTHKKKELVVSVGRLTNQKQQWVMIDAFSEFHQNHPSYKLIIYGEGENRNKLEKQVEELKLKDFVLLPGRSKEVLQDIISAQMFVLTSLYEGMSNALAEAMCLGLPCISTKVSGATDLINNGDNGFLVEVGDVGSIAEKMNLLADNPELAKKIALKASDVHALLDEEIVSEQWVKYLKGIIST